MGPNEMLSGLLASEKKKKKDGLGTIRAGKQ